MIELTVNPDGKLEFYQHTPSPIVYLDNWALKDIALDSSLAHRLIEAIKRRSGTLALSWLNFVELSGLGDSRQFQVVASLLESVTPHIAFLNLIPQAVINQENELLKGASTIGPHLDRDLLRVFAYFRRQSLNPLSVSEFLLGLRDPACGIIRESSRKFMENLYPLLVQIRKKIATSLKYEARAKAAPKGPEIPRLTRYIYQDAARHLARNRIIMTSNHWRDFFHMVVPLAYCNYVLLDRTWATIAKEILGRIKKSGFQAETSAVFSPKELPKFWISLEDPAYNPVLISHTPPADDRCGG